MKKILILFLLFSFIGFNSQAETLVRDDGNPTTKIVKMQTDLSVNVAINNQTIVFDTIDIGLDIPTNNYTSNQTSVANVNVDKSVETQFDIPIDSGGGYLTNLYKQTLNQIQNKRIFSRADFTDTNKIPIAWVSNYTLELRTC